LAIAEKKLKRKYHRAEARSQVSGFKVLGKADCGLAFDIWAFPEISAHRPDTGAWHLKGTDQ
jgi:hypothetical protein